MKKSVVVLLSLIAMLTLSACAGASSGKLVMATNADSQFRLTFPVGKSDFSIGYADNILSVGSCFAENVAERLSQSRLRVTVNQFGILYNPLSISSALHICS